MPVLATNESMIDLTATNLADALVQASAVLPTDCARRVVILSDGNENLGNAWREASRLSHAGVGIDVVPAPSGKQSDVLVERVVAPPVGQTDRPMEIRVVLEHRTGDDRSTSGALRLVRKSAGLEESLGQQHVVLPPGKSVFVFQDTPSEADFFVYEARFAPDEPAHDRFIANNVATGFVDVLGPGRVLLIEDA